MWNYLITTVSNGFGSTAPRSLIASIGNIAKKSFFSFPDKSTLTTITRKRRKHSKFYTENLSRRWRDARVFYIPATYWLFPARRGTASKPTAVSFLRKYQRRTSTMILFMRIRRLIGWRGMKGKQN